MKRLILIILFLIVTGCKTEKQCCVSETNAALVEDSTNSLIYKQQEALAIYIMSLSEKERQEWIRGTFTEEEMNALLDSLEIKITEPE